jgi:glycosyltransferase involved in cell wall biosynthesis
VTGRPSALLVAPVMPASAGNGLAMRAGLLLDALAADHAVSLLVVPVADPGAGGELPAFVRRRAVRAEVLDLAGRGDPAYPAGGATVAARRAYPRPALARFATAPLLREAAARAGRRFAVVHVMRLYLAPFAAPFLAAGPARPLAVLDLDDDEPRTRRRLASLHARRGEGAAAALEAAEADKYGALERAWLPRFDRVLVCSESDRAAVMARVPGVRLAVVPNAVAVPPAVARPPPGPALRLLLVGSLGYVPNADAALWLCDEVLPRLRAATTRPVHAALVGGRPPAAVARLAAREGVTVAGTVPDVGPWYARADVAVAPLRAGGGTRIKVLEAFAHRVPVVATPVGAEGLEAQPGRHLLVAETPEAFAEACRRVGEEPALARRLATAAHTLVRARYARPAVLARAREIYRAP